MPRPRKNQLIPCRYFSWRLKTRNGFYHADGRSNSIDVGRHSLGTDDLQEAQRMVHELDHAMAVKHGLATGPLVSAARRLPFAEGRQKYEAFTRRPRVMRGTSEATQKRYRTAFDKFQEFLGSRRITTWNEVDRQLMHEYATHLEKKGYAPQTIRKESVTLVQAHKWLRDEGHLVGAEPLRLAIKKVQGQRAYCYREVEVTAMLELCDSNPKLSWLGNMIVALAWTGLRISELASLRWSDVDLEKQWLSIADESGLTPREGRELRSTKNGQARGLPIKGELLARLTKMRRSGDHVFYGPRGGRLKPDTARRILIREVLEPLEKRFPSQPQEQGFKDGRLHSFRHYFASLCANSGVPEAVVMAWLGHQDSEMVRHYYHLKNEEAHRQMERLTTESGKRLAGRDESRNHQTEHPSREIAEQTTAS